jgi:hypothetical protein
VNDEQRQSGGNEGRHVRGFEPDGEQHSARKPGRGGKIATLAPQHAGKRDQRQHDLRVVMIDLARTEHRQKRHGRQRDQQRGPSGAVSAEARGDRDRGEHRRSRDEQRPDAASKPLGQIRRDDLPEHQDQAGNACVDQARPVRIVSGRRRQSRLMRIEPGHPVEQPPYLGHAHHVVGEAQRFIEPGPITDCEYARRRQPQQSNLADGQSIFRRGR